MKLHEIFRVVSRVSRFPFGQCIGATNINMNTPSISCSQKEFELQFFLSNPPQPQTNGLNYFRVW